MSVINKEPFIKKLLASCSSEELDTLATLINGGGNQTPIKRTANPIDTPEIPHISVSDKGIQLCSLTINYTNFLGYLVYTDLFCALISFTDAQVLKIFDLTEDKTRPNTIDEAINILELRSALFEAIGGGTEVIANPELAGTESPLTGLQIGDTKYSVSGGNTKYLHSILVRQGSTPNWLWIKIFAYTEDSQPYTSLVEILDKVAGGFANHTKNNVWFIADNYAAGRTISFVVDTIYKASANSLGAYVLTINTTDGTITRNQMTSFTFISDEIINI